MNLGDWAQIDTTCTPIWCISRGILNPGQQRDCTNAVPWWCTSRVTKSHELSSTCSFLPISESMFRAPWWAIFMHWHSILSGRSASTSREMQGCPRLFDFGSIRARAKRLLTWPLDRCLITLSSHASTGQWLTSWVDEMGLELLLKRGRQSWFLSVLRSRSLFCRSHKTSCLYPADSANLSSENRCTTF